MTERNKIREKRNKTYKLPLKRLLSRQGRFPIGLPRAGWSPGLLAKTFPALHERIATQMEDMIKNGVDIPKWMTTGETILYQKDPGKGNAVGNYRPISCLLLMRKLMAGMIANNVYEKKKERNT